MATEERDYQGNDRPTETHLIIDMRRDQGLRPAREVGPIQRSLSRLSNIIDGLDSALDGLCVAIEPVIGPELDSKFPDEEGDAVQHVETSEIAARIERLINQMEAITRRVRTTQGRVEL